MIENMQKVEIPMSKVMRRNRSAGKMLTREDNVPRRSRKSTNDEFLFPLEPRKMEINYIYT